VTRVVWKRRPPQALSLYVHRGPFDFVLSDWLLVPGRVIKSGIDLCSAIRKLNPEQPMAIHTAEPLECKERLCEILEGITILKKPYRMKALECDNHIDLKRRRVRLSPTL
jgi:hypothetical protein